ncbi:SGNH/GDSL hydrolase family protein [Dyella sp. A6]|uniref:SGNH/GDSL hydrolase family protein n=1 Tax=Dyella aluminiiresistens TaxID=3069105 RepID=UPI002E7A4B02|nr:SGNH/GDSL hydrolase family protein [Dyella sp. A6]
MPTKRLVFLAGLFLAVTAAHADTPAVGIVDHPCATEPSMQEAGGWNPWHVWLYAHDYGQLCYYRRQNAALPAPSPATPRVVFMGDSITEIWHQQDPHFFTDGRIDRGISGQTTSQMLVRFRQDVIDLHPAVVHIMAGTNDIAGNTGNQTLGMVENHLATMAELAHAHGIRIVLASVPPSDHMNWQPTVKPAPVIRRLNRWIKAYAARHGYVYVDYYHALTSADGGMRPGLSSDGVHPTKKGYAIMEPLTLAAIRKALAKH